ncbi:MAG: tetratricopeptide repeat protein [Desulfatibacillum sp.]|nr:tetratricopeptide repeat protein [Desulfatibacillum sp.]
MFLKPIYQILILALATILLFAPAPVTAKIQSWSEAGLEELEQGLYDEAIASFTRAIEIHPRNWQAYNNRGIVYGIKGQQDLAIADYGKAIGINPDYADAYSNRGAACFYKGKWADALADCSKALSLDPGRIWAQNQLAWILATCPEADYRNGKKAVDLAQKALKVEDNLLFYDTLAAAYAECGQFEKSVDFQLIAIDRLRKSDQAPPDTLASYEERLRYYQAGLPWHIGSNQIPDRQLQQAVSQENLRPKSPRQETRPLQIEIEGSMERRQQKQESKSIPTPPNPEEFSIQAGAFLSVENASKQMAFLKSRGYPARVQPLRSASGKVWHLVLVGSYPTQEQAKSAAGDLTARENVATAVFPVVTQ